MAGDLPVDAVLSCAFGSPYEGDIAPGAGARPRRPAAAGRLRGHHAARTPPAWPRPAGSPRWWRWSAPTSGSTCTRPGAPPWCAPTRRMQLGVTRFDTSVGGLGGSPFAAGAAGQPRHRGAGGGARRPRGAHRHRRRRRSSRPPPWPVSWSVGRVPSRVAAAGPRTRLSQERLTVPHCDDLRPLLQPEHPEAGRHLPDLRRAARRAAQARSRRRGRRGTSSCSSPSRSSTSGGGWCSSPPHC